MEAEEQKEEERFPKTRELYDEPIIIGDTSQPLEQKGQYERYVQSERIHGSSIRYIPV